MGPAFTPGEQYRIQNVEYGTYLEMVQRPTGPQLVLRAHKAFSENQQWSFETFPSRQGFILQNLGGSVRSSGAPTYIHFNGTTTLNRTEGVSVSLASLGDEHLIKLLNHTETASRLLCSSGHDTVTVKDDNGGVQLPHAAEDSFKWRLIPVWPSIPGDQIYTIRNIVSGLALNINPTLVSGSSASGDAKVVGIKSAQQWEVKPLLNGKIHLKNVSLNLFVRLSKNDLSLIGGEEGEPWQLTRVGGIGYTITVQPPRITGTGGVTFALTLLEGSNQIVLAPSNDLSNQIWFLEWAPNQLQSRLDGVMQVMELVVGSNDQSNGSTGGSPL